MKLIIFFIIFSQFSFGNILYQLDKSDLTQLEKMYGKKSLKRVEYLKKEIDSIKEQKFIYTKIYQLNTLINKIRYKKNKAHWNSEHKASFLEFIGSGFGNSFDFATAKYSLLVDLGLDEKKFAFFQTSRKGINKIKYDTQDYFVLGYYPKTPDEYIILDCYSDKLIPLTTERKTYTKIDITQEVRENIIKNMFNLDFEHTLDKKSLDGRELAKDLNLQADSKTLKQWRNIFSSLKDMKSFGIDQLNEKEKLALQTYLLTKATDLTYRKKVYNELAQKLFKSNKYIDDLKAVAYSWNKPLYSRLAYSKIEYNSFKKEANNRSAKDINNGLLNFKYLF